MNLSIVQPMSTLGLIKKYGKTHLIVDGKTPLISQGPVQEEALLYQLDRETLKELLNQVSEILHQPVTENTHISTLSGGQQITLAIYMALHSSAEKILFVEIFSSLDAQRKELVQNRLQTEPKGRITLGEDL